MSGLIQLGSVEFSVSELDEFAQIAITRTGDNSRPVRVEYRLDADSATNGADFTGQTGTILDVTLPAGEDVVYVPVPILDDGLSEPTERFTISLVNVDSGALRAPRSAQISILDDENPVEPVEEPPLVSDYDVEFEPLITGLFRPIDLEFSTAGSPKLYVANKQGVITVHDPATGAEQGTVLDISQQVNSFADRGLINIALHPDFASNPYLYAFYVVDPPETQGMTGDARPDGGGNRFAHLVRYTLDAGDDYRSIVPGSEQIILGGAGQSLSDISGGGAVDSTSNIGQPESGYDPVTGEYVDDYVKVDSRSHAGGALDFGPDGALYVTIGDGTSYSFADPRSVSVQNLDSLSGKVLRIDPITGAGLPDNPFVEAGAALTENQSKVYQVGLRNPFSIAFDDAGRLFVTDTGWSTWEEINQAGAGANFGWPFYEGADGNMLERNPRYAALPEAQAFYDAVESGEIELSPPFRAFHHRDAEPGYQFAAIVGGDAFTTGADFPESLQNHYFFSDFNDGEIYAVNANDRTDLKYIATTESGRGPVNYTIGPDGLYYADLDQGTISRLDISEQEPEPIRFGTSTYVLGTAGQSWTEARAEARAAGGQVLEVDSAAEAAFIQQNFGDGGPIWLGFNDVLREGRFVGADNVPAGYADWLPGEPNNGGGRGQDFARIAAADGRWDDAENDVQTLLVDGTWVPSESVTVIEFEDPVTYEGSRYELVGRGLGWYSARIAAALAGGDLLEIESEGEAQFILDTFGLDGPIWLGANDRAQEGTFRGLDGDPIGYADWLPGEPNNTGNQDFARIVTEAGQWDDGNSVASTIFSDGRWITRDTIVIAEFEADTLL